MIDLRFLVTAAAEAVAAPRAAEAEVRPAEAVAEAARAAADRKKRHFNAVALKVNISITEVRLI